MPQKICNSSRQTCLTMMLLQQQLQAVKEFFMLQVQFPHRKCPTQRQGLLRFVEVIAPAVTGTLNVLKACTGAKIKRVVVVSSVASVVMNPSWPQDKLMDEECWSDKEYCRKTENWYCLSKTLAEADALDYAAKHGLDVVTVCPAMVWVHCCKPQ
ncbi:cinnamoyl-CoA reductase 2-like [Iris pallida]|uniref:Cinnamoyl-CoA reductase 2-like n=1 Tax=Iris pallida TaxID=29817 RepID=A0AAX6DH81_IRIPA|nr:cinnamoyl-CoA reductase 2-like [Iris pallida]